jgi:hypothetical protein
VTPALSPERLAAPGATRVGRSVPTHCPGPAVGARNDHPHRIQHGGASADDVLSGAAHAVHEGPSLDDVLSRAWEGLTSHNTVSCPVCSGAMAPRYGSGAVPVGGRCRRCGSSLG